MSIKAHEETWRVVPLESGTGYDLRTDAHTLVAYFESPDFEEEARARLAAQAPAMARLLLVVRDRLFGGVLPGEMADVLRAAGVIP